MKNRYGAVSEIEVELKNVEIENFLDFKANDEFEFAKYEGCDGPLLGHLEFKCRGKQGVRYWSEAVKSFKHWLKRVPGFREAVAARQQKKEEMRFARIGEFLKIAIESVEKKNTPGTTT